MSGQPVGIAVRLFAVVAMLIALLFVVGGNASAASSDFSASLSPVTTPISSGDPVGYVLNMQCSNPTGCGTVTEVISAPPGWTAADGTPTAALQTGITDTVNPTTGAITLTWVGAAAGNAPQVQLDWPTDDYTTIPGAQPVTAQGSDAGGDSPIQPWEVAAAVVPICVSSPSGPWMAMWGVTRLVPVSDDVRVCRGDHSEGPVTGARCSGEHGDEELPGWARVGGGTDTGGGIEDLPALTEQLQVAWSSPSSQGGSM